MLFALKLVWRGGAQRRIKGDIVAARPGGARLDIAAMLAFGAGAAAAAMKAPCQAVERRIEAARGELLAGLDLFATVPPVGVLRIIEDILRRGGRFGVGCFGVGLTGLIGQPLTFFSASAAASSAADGTWFACSSSYESAMLSSRSSSSPS